MAKKPIFIYLQLIGLLVLTGVFLAACNPQKGSQVLLKNSKGKSIKVSVEIADTPESREKGLMYREEMPNNHGMLFLMPDEIIQTFWMKNTPLSLDIIFIDRNWKIAGIIEDAVPYSTDHLSIEKPSLYVLEVNGGFCKKHEIKEGDWVEYIPQ